MNPSRPSGRTPAATLTVNIHPLLVAYAVVASATIAYAGGEVNSAAPRQPDDASGFRNRHKFRNRHNNEGDPA